MLALYPRRTILGRSPFDMLPGWISRKVPAIAAERERTRHDGVIALQWVLSERLLELGCNVVGDWGLWKRHERDASLTRARKLDVRVVLCVVDAPMDELVRRVRSRSEGSARQREFVIAHLEQWARLFEPPTPEELALYDDEEP